MAVIVNGDGILTGVSSLTTDLTDITSGRGTVTGVATVGTLQLGAGVSMGSPRSQNAAIFTNNSEFLTVDDAGRVGVGTVTPNSDAHPQNVGKINVGFITARSVAGDIDANTLVVAGISTFVGALNATLTGTASGNAVLSGSTNNTVTTVTGANAIQGEANLTFDGNTLTVSAPSNDTPFIVDTASTNGAHLRFQKDGSNQHFVGAGGGISLGDREDLSLRAYDNVLFATGNSSTEKLRIDSSGNLILKAANAAFKSESSSSGDWVRMYAGAGTGKWDIYGNGANLRFSDNDAAGNVAFDRPVIVGTTTVDHTLGVLAANSTTPAFGIQNPSNDENINFSTYHDSSGIYLGIGANAKFDANGNFAVDTTAHRSAILSIDGRNHGRFTFACGDSGGTPSTKATIDRFGNLTIEDGDLNFNTAGHGIGFSVTSDPSGMTSELLDDYEEGSWTPDLHFGAQTTGITYSNLQGVYTKIGRVVTLNWTIELSSKGSATGDARIYGYPYAPAALLSGTSVQANGISAYWNNFDPDLYYMAFFATTSYISIRSMNADGLTDALDAMSNSDFGNSSTFRGTITYFAAS